MSRKRLRIILPFAILVAGAGLTAVMVSSRKSPPTRPPEEYAPLVRVLSMTPRAVRLTVRANGTVTPRTESALVAEVAGRIVSTAPAFASGGFFQKGDVLVSIDPVDYELAVVSARGRVAQAKVLLQTEEARAEVAREEWAELGEGKESPLATRELQLEESRAELAAAEAALRQAERNLARTNIRAPYVCRVRDKLVDVGRYVTPGTPAARVYAIDYAEIRLPIADADLAYLDLPVDYRDEPSRRLGPQVRLSADFAGARREWWGQIVRVEGEIDPMTRMVHVVARVDDPYGRAGGQSPLPVGLFVEAEILGLEVPDAVVLPRAALRGRETVYVVDGEDRLRFRRVEVLRASRDEVVVSAGLAAGERVCISTLEAVTDGMKVRALDGAAPTGAPEAASTGGAQ
ncbi:MAG: efflux RND transporter periplasmic adaptor subunit [Candidatus Krumholzibacteria bacterium]|nr:efflux RND transporter periplasmic adaptor subunit [Candidatus Krumholzibacteria bacterium]